MAMTMPALRHPLDPEPTRSSKAGGVLALGVAALVTGALVGGVVPGTLALLLARQARREAYAAGGFLTGARLVRTGERLAWTGIVLAIATLVLAMVIGILDFAGTPTGTDFDSNVD